MKRGGKSLAGGWLGLIGWLAAIIVGLAAIAAALVLAGCGGGSFATSGGTGESASLAVRGGYAYWFDPFIGLGRAPISDPAFRTSLLRTNAGDGHLHLNSTDVFWRANDEVHRMPHAGAETSTLVGPTIAGVAFGLAVDDEAVYYSRGPTLLRHALADGVETTLLEDRTTTSLVLDGGSLIGTTCEPGHDAIWRLDGGSAARILERGCPEVATLDDAFVYAFDLVDGRPSIVRVPRGGGESVALIETASSVFAVRDGLLYAVALDDTIVRVPVAGGAPTVLAAPGRVFGLAVDDALLYFTTENEVGRVVLFTEPLP